MNLRHEGFIGWTFVVIVAGVGAFGLAGCGKSSGPEEAAKAVAPVPPAPVVAEGKDRNQAPPSVQKAPSRDEALAARVAAALAADDRLRSFAIDVRSKNGVVDLFGTVDSRSSRDRAAKLAAAVEGVQSVGNHLQLVSGS